MFGYRVSLWRNAWKRNTGLRAFATVAIAAAVTFTLLTVVVWSVTAPTAQDAPVLPKTEYCYTSEDGDWLICRLEE